MSKILSFQYDMDSDIDGAKVVQEVADYFGLTVTIAARIPESFKDPYPLSAQPHSNGDITTQQVQQAQQDNGAAPVDKNGLPWDARIHSTPATLTSKGVWRAKRGVDDLTVQQVEAQLRQLMAIPAPATSAAQHAVNTVAAQAAAIIDIKTDATRGTPEYSGHCRAYAHQEALRVAGPQMIEDVDLRNHMENHQALTIGPEAANWLRAYSAKYHDAISAFVEANPGTTHPTLPTPPVPTVPPVPAATVAPPPPPVTNVITPDAAMQTFPQLMRWVVQNQVAGKLTPDQVANTCQALGMVGADGKGSIAAVMQRMDFAPSIVAMLQVQGAV